MTKENIKYWNNFYKDKSIVSARNFPSQFAAFCLGVMNENNIDHIYDLGSGDGRDAVFFSNYEKQVIALDKSKSAIELLKKRTKKNKKIDVVHYDLNKKLPDFKERNRIKIAFYSRFLIHVLNEKSLENFFKNCSSCMKIDDILFIEYRGIKDRNRPKETSPHFRKFYSEKKIDNIIKKNYLKITYQVEGNGFAKWKKDDAFVCRKVIKKIN